MSRFSSKTTLRSTSKISAWVLVIVLLTVLVPFTPVSADNMIDSGYLIESYHVDVEITDANLYRVNQTIDVNFLENRHGIYFYTPYLMEVELPGADESRYRAAISKIRVPDYEYETSTENSYKVIKIGDADYTINGRHSYEISYNYDIGMDHSDQADFLYYNLIGPQWTSPMEEVTFSIEMPHEFDPSGINITVGSYGSEDSTRAVFDVQGQTISGSVPGGLDAYEGLTIYLELPQGYFTKAVHNYAIDAFAIVLILLIAALIIYFYIRYGRDRLIPETVEFYAPNGIDPAHAGLLADGMPDSKDMIALIMYWADLGYINIIEQDKKISLKRLHQLPGSSPKYQLTIFNGLFQAGEFVTLDSLKEKFYTTMSTGKSQLQGAYQDKITEPSSRKAQGGAVILSILPLGISIGRAVLSKPFDSMAMMVFTTILAVAMMILWLPILISNRMRWRVRSKIGRIFPIIGAAVILPIVHFLNAAAIMDTSRDPLYVSMIAAIVSLITVPFAVKMNRRTLEGEQLFARLMGFRNFMIRAEKDRIEKLVMDNPSYFYDVLPYAYVLGVSDKWARNFEGLDIQPPSWYYTDTMTAFTAIHFANQMDRTASSMNSVMISQPASSGGGGGGGGGGFSGGGFGGGGGGSW